MSYFEYHLLKLVGIAPEVHHCLRCSAFFGPEEPAYFAFDQGGTVCSRCLRPGSAFELVKRADLESLQKIAQDDFLEKTTSPFNRKILLRFLEGHLFRHVKSREFLRKWPELIPLEEDDWRAWKQA